MTTAAELYSELKPDIGLVAGDLFDLSEKFLRTQGNFLPHGAVLTDEGAIKLVAAAPQTVNDQTTSTAVLPLLHDGLRQISREVSLRAIGVAENVTVAPEGKHPTEAIKVLLEHKRGLTIALYLPYEKKLFRGYVMGSQFAVAAAPEVNAWTQGAA